MAASSTLSPFMSDYLIYKADQQPFDKDEAHARLKSVGVIDLRLRSERDTSLVEGTFHLGSDSLDVRLNPDGYAFGLSDSGPAAYEFAIRLQAAYDEPLQIIDIGYSFDLPLKDYTDADALLQAIQAAYEADDEEEEEDEDEDESDEDNGDDAPPAEE